MACTKGGKADGGCRPCTRCGGGTGFRRLTRAGGSLFEDEDHRLGSRISVIREVDICKHEPWDFPNHMTNEWFFFCPKDRKYQNGQRLNRQQSEGYWKQLAKIDHFFEEGCKSWMKKTLVYYLGRAPAREELIGSLCFCRLFKKVELKLDDVLKLQTVVRLIQLSLLLQLLRHPQMHEQSEVGLHCMQRATRSRTQPLTPGQSSPWRKLLLFISLLIVTAIACIADITEDQNPWKFYCDPSAGPNFLHHMKQIPRVLDLPPIFMEMSLNCISNNNEVSFSMELMVLDPNEFLNPAALVSSDGDQKKLHKCWTIQFPKRCFYLSISAKTLLASATAQDPILEDDGVIGNEKN
nr:NAC domain-containing protein 62-like [Ipomoea batatas]